MHLSPEEWNVVVIGRWNPALFTPARISSRIFGLPEGTPVEVYVVLDEVQLPRVKHNGITVAPSSIQLVVTPEKSTFAELERAINIAHKVIEDLPRTPLDAAGFNLRYRAGELPLTLARRFSDDLDRRFATIDRKIVGRQFQRLLEFDNGRMRVQVTSEPNEKAELLLNFELRSTEHTELQEWLKSSIRDVRNTATEVFEKVLELLGEDYDIEAT